MDLNGYPVRRLENDFLQIDYLEQGGPRLVSLVVKGHGANLLAELPELTNETVYGTYHFVGGHRLWHAPEGMPRSYIPDDSGLKIEALADGVRLIGAVEAGTGLRKTLELHLAANAPVLTIDHALKNEGLWPVECAPWAITQLALGGVAMIPQQDGVPEAQLLPDRRMSIWNYTRLQDKRLWLDDDFILVHGEAKLPPCKIGVMNTNGWAAYQVRDLLLIKRFTPQTGQPHPDFGCNTEIYINDKFIELETLGPVVKLDPGESTNHTEIWEVRTGIKMAHSIEGVREMAKKQGF